MSKKELFKIWVVAFFSYIFFVLDRLSLVLFPFAKSTTPEEAKSLEGRQISNMIIRVSIISFLLILMLIF